MNPNVHRIYRTRADEKLIRNAQVAGEMLYSEQPDSKAARELHLKAVDAVREYKYHLERQTEIEDDVDEDGKLKVEDFCGWHDLDDVDATCTCAARGKETL